jgi:hypothetical protein
LGNERGDALDSTVKVHFGCSGPNKDERAA